MSKAKRKQRPYSPRRAKLATPAQASGPAAFASLVETKLAPAKKEPAEAAPEAPKDTRQVPDALSSEAIQASQESTLRHRKARRNAKSRGGRLLFG
ncbi:MAG TPA: hypothetical protein VN758_08370 [Solirubrobacterales bacterium]|nr:hypothetical protein [Solirubrobacterales bacterium]